MKYSFGLFKHKYISPHRVLRYLKAYLQDEPLYLENAEKHRAAELVMRDPYKQGRYT